MNRDVGKLSYYVKRFSVFLITVALVVGLVGCDGSCSCAPSPSLYQYVLAIFSTEGGGTTPGEVTFTYDEGTVVNLVATPDAGYRFVKWTGDVDTIADVYAVSTNITMSGDYSITAEFAWQYNLSTNSTAGGSVTEPGEGVFPCDEGTVVDLVAEAEESYHFVQWTGNVSAIADVYAAETTITMNGDYSITANFILFGGGSGTAVDPYEIADWRHLDNARNYLNHHFILINDLDSNSAGYTELASATANEGKGWEPIGPTGENDKFAGSFDSQGHAICDLFIDRPAESNVGLFGVVSEGGVIENVGVVNGNVTGQDDVGGLVGKNEGTVSNSYSSGSVTGDDYIGGLMGKNEGTASNSSSTSSVTGNNRVGGLIGQNSEAMSNSYSAGSVTGNDYVGGLMGRNEGTASNSYSTGSVTGNDYVGGLMGENEGTVEDSFWDTQTSGQGSSAAGTGKNTTEMKDFTTFSGATWDIFAVGGPGERNTGYIWNIVDGATYPFLSWESVV